MAPDKKDNKRKAAAATDAPAKKSKKVDPKPGQATDASKPALKKKKGDVAEDKSVKSKANGQPAREIKPRKRAADFLSDDDDSEADVAAEVKEPQEKPSNKKSKKEDAEAAKDNKSKSSDKKPKTISKASKAEAQNLDADSDSDASAEDGEDDQTTALIKGFESSGDEDASEDEGFDANKPLPQVPDSKKAKRKILKKQKKSDEPEEPGTVYIGRIPHGFYEHQMRAYFSQFGEITRLRLSRNRITGRSKHYAFVEFSSISVAKIVAATMDNYLMYGHILKCKYVPSEQLHPEIWKGANRRFKRTPWNRIEKKRLEKGKTREQWAGQIAKEQKKRQAKVNKLKELGYEMDLPQLKSVDEVPVQKAIEDEPKSVEAKADEPAKAIEAPKAEAEAEKDDTPKKSKKAKKDGKPAEAPKQDEPKPKEAKEAAPAGKKAKKADKKKGKQ